jgi:hypothetical protein
MATSKCPLCESPCIIKIIATQDARWCEVDVCKMCGTMYPRGRPAEKKAKARKNKTSKK